MTRTPSRLRLILLSAMIGICFNTPAAEITYLANEGFLLAGGGEKVLVDALFGDGLAGYAVVPAELRSKLEAAQPPFDGVDLVLATHFHDDHFDPRAVGRFLAAAPQARFVSTPQAVERLRTEYDGFEGIAPRVRAVLPAEGDAERLESDGVALTVYNLHHGRGRPIENLGFLVEVGGARLLHVGDTMVDAEELAVLDLPAGWFGPGGRDGLLAGIAERAPGVLLAVEPGARTELGRRQQVN